MKPVSQAGSNFSATLLRPCSIHLLSSLFIRRNFAASSFSSAFFFSRSFVGYFCAKEETNVVCRTRRLFFFIVYIPPSPLPPFAVYFFQLATVMEALKGGSPRRLDEPVDETKRNETRDESAAFTPNDSYEALPLPLFVSSVFFLFFPPFLLLLSLSFVYFAL